MFDRLTDILCDCDLCSAANDRRAVQRLEVFPMLGVKAVDGPLTAYVRVGHVLKTNLRVSYRRPPKGKDTMPALIIESIEVEEAHRRQGHCKRWIEKVSQTPESIKLVIIEGVQNKILAEALLRWGWECDPGVMDFYKRLH